MLYTECTGNCLYMLYTEGTYVLYRIYRRCVYTSFVWSNKLSRLDTLELNEMHRKPKSDRLKSKTNSKTPYKVRKSQRVGYVTKRLHPARGGLCVFG